MKKKTYRNGYSDGSGKGLVVMEIDGEETAILASHWGCDCCDRETKPKDSELVDKLCAFLNKHKIKLEPFTYGDD